ncbi:MAG: hypothetical protein QOG64_1881 [Acidimicrobiaceae bacterium]|jgi:anti-sigma factor RsiW|nr:hypothetical protein [Acidimicrobiaceae bacterium]
MTTGGDHLGDLISALLDGELDPVEQAAARDHLQGCAACQTELQATSRAKAMVRALPMLDPPFGVIEPILVPARPGSRRAAGGRPRRAPVVLAAGAAAAAAVVLLSIVPGHQPAVKPPVATFVDAHAAASTGGDPISGLAPVAVPASFAP